MRSFQNESGLDGLRACVALGMFDGVHKGHEALLSTCVRKAKEDNVPSVVYTYHNSPHPQKQAEVLGFLTPEDEKLMLCEQIGIDLAISQEFTYEYSQMSPEMFAQLLFQKQRTSTLVCGHDYRFGHKGMGDVALLQKLGQASGVGVICVEDVLYEGLPISSSRIRKTLLQGDCELASILLGRPYSVSVRFANGISRWPDNKARIANGRYICGFLDEQIEVIVSDKGIIQVKKTPYETRLGSMQFLRRSGNA